MQRMHNGRRCVTPSEPPRPAQGSGRATEMGTPACGSCRRSSSRRVSLAGRRVVSSASSGERERVVRDCSAGRGRPDARGGDGVNRSASRRAGSRPREPRRIEAEATVVGRVAEHGVAPPARPAALRGAATPAAARRARPRPRCPPGRRGSARGRVAERDSVKSRSPPPQVAVGARRRGGERGAADADRERHRDPGDPAPF